MRHPAADPSNAILGRGTQGAGEFRGTAMRLSPFTVSRRGLLVGAGGLMAAGPQALAADTAPAAHAPAAATDALTPDAAMERLMAGNARYVQAKLTHPNNSVA